MFSTADSHNLGNSTFNKFFKFHNEKITPSYRAPTGTTRNPIEYGLHDMRG